MRNQAAHIHARARLWSGVYSVTTVRHTTSVPCHEGARPRARNKLLTVPGTLYISNIKKEELGAKPVYRADPYITHVQIKNDSTTHTAIRGNEGHRGAARHAKRTGRIEPTRSIPRRCRVLCQRDTALQDTRIVVLHSMASYLKEYAAMNMMIVGVHSTSAIASRSRYNVCSPDITKPHKPAMPKNSRCGRGHQERRTRQEKKG